jgi:hypothetical protein
MSSSNLAAAALPGVPAKPVSFEEAFRFWLKLGFIRLASV